MSHLKIKNGFALATALVLMGVILIGAGGILTISRIEARVSRSQKESIQAYYAAEAGAQNAIWRINNDQTLLDGLDAGALDLIYTSEDQLLNLRDISVTVQSISPGRAEIISTGLVNEDKYPAQRRVKVEIFRGSSESESLLGDIGLYSNHDSTFYGSENLIISNGDIYSGEDEIFISASATISDQIMALNNYSSTGSTITSGGIMASNYPPAPTSAPMPGVDFNTLKANADAYYTNAQFKALIREGGTVELPGPITFVENGVNISTGQLRQGQKTLHLIVHGLLVVTGNFHFLTPSAPGPWDLDFQVLDDTGGPSGIIVSNNIQITGRDNPMNIQGLLYGSGNIRLTDTGSFNIDGGIIGGSFYDNTSDNIVINIDPVKIGEVIGFVDGGETGNPSIIQIEHWEEEY